MDNRLSAASAARRPSRFGSETQAPLSFPGFVAGPGFARRLRRIAPTALYLMRRAILNILENLRRPTGSQARPTGFIWCDLFLPWATTDFDTSHSLRRLDLLTAVPLRVCRWLGHSFLSRTELPHSELPHS